MLWILLIPESQNTFAIHKRIARSASGAPRTSAFATDVASPWSLSKPPVRTLDA
jgi:hypothetical protein